MIPIQGHAGQAGMARLFVLVPVSCCSAEAFLGLRGGVQCQVIMPRRLLLFSTTFLQPNSGYRQFLLLQNPFSSPVPRQVLVFPRNECIGDGVGRLQPTGWASRVWMRDERCPPARLGSRTSAVPLHVPPLCSAALLGASLVSVLLGTSVSQHLR